MSLNNYDLSAGMDKTSGSLRKKPVVFEYFIFFYLLAALLWCGVYRILPFYNFIAKTPLIHLLLWLRRIGIVLVILNLVNFRKLVKVPGLLFLSGICAAAAISSFMMRQYGCANNLDTILWEVIIFALFYGAVYITPMSLLRRFIPLAYGIFLVFWSAVCALSCTQYLLQIGRDGLNHSSSVWLGGEGFSFHRHRLIGLFGYPEYGAVTGIMLFAVGAYYFRKTKQPLIKAAIVILNIPVFFYLVLSLSRNALLALLEIVFLGVFLLSWKSMRKKSENNRIGRPFLLGLIAAAVLLIVYLAAAKVSGYLPGFFSSPEESAAGYSPVAGFAEQKTTRASQFNGPVLSSLVTDKNRLRQVISPGDGQIRTTAAKSKEGDDNENEMKLSRYYGNGDISTGRGKIWKSYFSISKEFGLFGLSPENAGFYIQEHHPDLFICTFIKRTDEPLYNSGYVFHPHSGYLKTFVSTGFLGLCFMLLFIGMCAWTVIRCIIQSRRLSDEFIFSLLVCVVGASAALFDLELFFNTNPTSLIFWSSLAILLKITPTGKTAKQPGSSRESASAEFNS